MHFQFHRNLRLAHTGGLLLSANFHVLRVFLVDFPVTARCSGDGKLRPEQGEIRPVSSGKDELGQLKRIEQRNVDKERERRLREEGKCEEWEERTGNQLTLDVKTALSVMHGVLNTTYAELFEANLNLAREGPNLGRCASEAPVCLQHGPIHKLEVSFEKASAPLR